MVNAPKTVWLSFLGKSDFLNPSALGLMDFPAAPFG